ncbi:hypothetical protein MP228_006500 [Amoeboaphelidium protococcarum]|nr:hypothetical protein MP228_006500 [Amoeboaphelidium protococcarum]
MIFANHLQSQSRVVLNQIYQDSPSSCLAVFRMLQYGSQLILMRLLTAPYELSISSVQLRSWFMSTPQGRLQYEQSVEQLKSLAILLPGPGSDVDDDEDVMGMEGIDGDLNADVVYTVNEQFKLGLTQTLLGTAERGSFGIQCQSIDLTKKASMLSPAQLEYYASTKWEGILHFMVGSGQQLKTVTPSQNVLRLLLDSGLMQVLDGDMDRKRKSSTRAATSDMHITNLGFQFLLQDIVTQVQSILLYYADAVQKLNGNNVRVQVEVFQMIFMLGQLQIGRPYEITLSQQSRYTETQITLLDDLSELGLVRIVQSDSNLLVFTPTQLCSAINASTSSSAVSSSSSLQIGSNKFNNTQVHQQDSFIIVETNFRVYAYTDSPLKISIISLFTQINARFPNFVVGQVTRDSVRRALRNGITAKLICQFLQSHAHPIVVKAQQQQQYGMSHQSNVPPSVIDQICLWEIERNRLALKDGFLYRDFSVEEEWEATLKYAQDLNILLWTSTPSTMLSQQSSSSSSVTGLSLPVNKRQLVVSAEGHQLLKEFVKNWSIQQKNQ